MSQTFKPRDWQSRFVREYQTNLVKNYLLKACVAAGKSAAALYAFDSIKSVLGLRFLIIVVPGEHLMRQYAQDARNLFNLNLFYSGTVKKIGRLPSPEELLSEGYHGLVVSYQWLTKGRNASKLADDLSKNLAGKVFLVLDEVHHATSERAFGQGCETAFPDDIISHRLMTTGTPFRSDNNRILGNWLNYAHVEDAIYICVPDFSYSLADALTDQIIPPFSFVTMEGEFSYRRGQAEYSGRTFDNAANEQELTDALNTAIYPEGDWVKEAILWAYKRMHRDKQKGLPECATYVRVSSIDAAGKMKQRIRSITGEDALVVVSSNDNPNSRPNSQSVQKSSQLIEEFAGETGMGARSWIIGVGMLGEGVTIKRLKYRIHATNIRAPLSFEQDLGRLLRLFPEDPPECVETLIPAHPDLIRLALDIMDEVFHAVKDKEENDDTEVDERDDENDGDREPIISSFLPISSTGELGTHILDGEEIAPDYANVAEWAIENNPTLKQWNQTPAHLAQALVNDAGMFNYLYEQYKQAVNNDSTQSTSSYIPPGFPSEYADFMPDQKITYTSKEIHKKVNRLSYMLVGNKNEEKRVEAIKVIYTKAKQRNCLPANRFIGYQGLEKMYEWLCNAISKASNLNGVEDL